MPEKLKIGSKDAAKTRKFLICFLLKCHDTLIQKAEMNGGGGIILSRFSQPIYKYLETLPKNYPFLIIGGILHSSIPPYFCA